MNDEQWVPQVDALIAAPKDHKLLFENEFVRVLDTNIAPGETANVHTHQYPASSYIPEEGSAIWSGPLAANSLKNI